MSLFAFLTLPGFLRGRKQQRHLLPKHSSLQPATLQSSVGKICLCVEPTQTLGRLKAAGIHNEQIPSAPVGVLKDSKNHKAEYKNRESFRSSAVHSPILRKDRLYAKYC